MAVFVDLGEINVYHESFAEKWSSLCTLYLTVRHPGFLW
jgi:hypothetical protein